MPDNVDFELVAASLRADTRDLDAFVEALAQKLEGSLPGRTRVDRRGSGMFSREKRVRRLEVTLADKRYDLEAHNGRVETVRSRQVRGIVLKTEPLPLDQWIDELSRDLSGEAETSEQARLALERLLEGS